MSWRKWLGKGRFGLLYCPCDLASDSGNGRKNGKRDGWLDGRNLIDLLRPDVMYFSELTSRF